MDNDKMPIDFLTSTTNEIVEVDKTELMESWAYHLAALVLFFIGFFGFTLNLFVIILMYKDVQLWTPMNIILINLICSDFLVSILGNPFTMVAAISHKWIFGQILCTVYGFFMALFGITSITTLTVLAFERYCLVAYPLSSRQFSTRAAVICIIFIWLYSLSLTTPPLFGWGAYVNEAADISCSVNWESKSLNATTYIIFLFIFGLVIPVIVISYSYINIVLTMNRNSARLGRKNRAESRVTLMIAIMIIAFLVAWSPYAIFALVEQFGPTELITPKMAVLPALIAKSSICYNPLIYVGLNTQFRSSWKRNMGKESTLVETIVNHITKSNNQPSLQNACQGKEELLKRKLTSVNRTKSTFGNKESDIDTDAGNREIGEGSGRIDGGSSGNDLEHCGGSSEAPEFKDDINLNVKYINESNDGNCDTKRQLTENKKIINHELTVFAEGKSALNMSNSYCCNSV